MKIYRTLENGMHRYYSNKAYANSQAVKGVRAYNNQGLEQDIGHSEREVEKINVPTTKAGLIEWLNDEASYTGWTTE